MVLFPGKRLQAYDLKRIQKTLMPVLKPFGKLYGFFMDRRARKYGCLQTHRTGVPCISIGNIALGGTGKTPLTDWLLGWAELHGKRAVVLTRGYGAKPPCYPYIVSAQSVAAQAGDEPLMLALAHPSAKVVVDPVRCRGAIFAEREYAPDFFVMDDGFQHLALHRDVDIVLLRPEDLRENWDTVIPAGMWREGASALARASVFLVRADEAVFDALKPLICSRLKACAAPIFSFALHAVGLEPVSGKLANEAEAQGAFVSTPPTRLEAHTFCAGAQSSEAALAPRRVVTQEADFGPYLLVSGVGSPADVRETATQCIGRAPEEHCVFADHHAYTTQEALRIGNMAKNQHLRIVTTSKDAQKLSSVADFLFYSIVVQPRFGAEALIPNEQDGGYRCVAVSFEQWWGQTAGILGLI